MANPDDAVRDAILRHLDEVHRKARSVKSVGIGIRDLQGAMKKKHGYKQQDVAGDLDYLVQKGWVREVVEVRDFTTPGGMTTQQERRTYKISDAGIDLLRGGASMYQRSPLASNINIATVSGVTIVGDGNVVNTAATDLAQVLDDLRKAVVQSDDYDDRTKLEVAADIDTIRSQIQKPDPDRSILSRAWEGVKNAVTVGEAVDLAVKAGTLIASIGN